MNSNDLHSERSFEELKSLLSQEGWFPLHRAVIQITGGMEEAAVVHFLINYHSRIKRSPYYKWDDGWFYCKISTMENELCLKRTKQQTIIKKLVELGLVETTRKGLPAKRFFRINPEVIKQAVIEWEIERSNDPSNGEYGYGPVEGLKPEKQEYRETETHFAESRYTGLPENCKDNKKEYSKKKESKKGRDGRQKAARRPPRSKVPYKPKPFELELAARLRSILIKHACPYVENTAERRGFSKNGLAKNFNALLNRGVPLEKIDDVLDWLDEHYNDPYVPHMSERVNSFLTKWEKFVDAKVRWEMDNGIEPEEETVQLEIPETDEFKIKIRKHLRQRGVLKLFEMAAPDDVLGAIEDLGLPPNCIDPVKDSLWDTVQDRTI